MRSLIRKDVAELFTARAFWLVLIATTLLVAQAYVDATRTYGEVKEVLPSLDGIVTPTAGAYDLAIMLLFPFVAIRLVASEKSSDALKLMLQWPASIGAQKLARGEAERTGVIAPEVCFEPEAFFAELGKRGIRVQLERT